MVAHAGLKERYHGPRVGPGPRVRLYGETTGETDEFGLPVRYPWASDYRGQAMVVYGHTPVPEPEWVNNTLCLDTGCVFGGTLTALRYPERELVSVPAERVYYEPAKPFLVNPAASEAPQPAHREPEVLDIADVTGRRVIETALPAADQRPRGERGRRAGGDEPVRDRPALAALPAADHGPVATSARPDLLEHPAEAFDAYRAEGVGRGGLRGEAHGLAGGRARLP